MCIHVYSYMFVCGSGEGVCARSTCVFIYVLCGMQRVCAYMCIHICGGWRGVCAQHICIHICTVWDEEGMCVHVYLYMYVGGREDCVHNTCVFTCMNSHFSVFIDWLYVGNSSPTSLSSGSRASPPVSREVPLPERVHTASPSPPSRELPCCL